MKERNPHNRASKSDRVANKVSGTSGSSKPSNARVRPNSKADEIGKKIPSSQPSQPSQSAAPQSTPRDYPSNPQPQPSKPSQPSGNNSRGCCLLPFTLGVLGIIGSLILIF